MSIHDNKDEQDIKATETFRNVKNAFAYESQAIVRYMFYAEIARNQGNTKAAELFDLMVKNEFIHAKVWFNLMSDSLTQNTTAHLRESAFGESDEWQVIYPGFARTAREEGLEEVAELFERISSIEADHERRFIELLISEENNDKEASKLQEIKENVYEEEAKYYCMFCGYPSETELDACPFCEAEASFLVA